ncbi:MAG: 2Fe-2S iron-sulfur cluster-binding protein [Candidatus Brevundimonas phytovorans]|nr:2Fe-2S iron-sulfur cluster-binding protein [Brevundimonas sp.]WEK56731.1 MAG: 2Fe-2S iron-sulfur cluster-binding protein [Brevundimonas sp.]
MPKVIFIQSDGSRQSVQARPGSSLMSAAVGAAVPGIDAECGGSMSCGTCHVHVDQIWRDSVGSASEDETALLEFVEGYVPASSRLSCQIVVTEDLDGLILNLST